MSWSITFIGKPENVAIALEKESEKLNGQSKIEFDSALPHLIALVKENFGTYVPVIRLTANGHGVGEVSRNCQVNLEFLGGSIV